MPERYIVDIKTARSRPFMRAGVIRILDTTTGPSNWHWVRKGTVAQWGSVYKINGKALDMNYTGPRSAFGKALNQAIDKAKELNSFQRIKNYGKA